MKQESENNELEVNDEYEQVESFLAGKLDERDIIEKRIYLLAISRKLFTHSLPLVVAEQCYEKLLQETRNLIVREKSEQKKARAYELLIKLIEEYNVRLLSTKIYWESPKAREEYKKFWEEYKKIEKDTEEGQAQKEILFIRDEIKKVNDEKIVKFYKNKLVELGALRKLKNSYITGGKYIKRVVRV